MKRSGSLLRATMAVSLIAVVSKLLGFIRQTLIASYYGATAETDVYFFAERMPSTLLSAICSSISTAFVAIYVKRMAEEGTDAGDRYASRILRASLLLGLLLTVLGILFSPLVVMILAPGFSSVQVELAIVLTRVMMSSFFLIMASAMLGAILQSKRSFIRSQLGTLFYNAVIILLTALFGRGQGMMFLTLVTILGLLGQATGLALCCRGRFTYTKGMALTHSDIHQIVHLSFPVLLGNSVIHLNTLVDNALCSILPSGSLSALAYAHTLNAFVTSIFINTFTLVIYPTLTSTAAERDDYEYGRSLSRALRTVTLLLVPISSITLLCAEDIVRAVYAHGSFDRTAVEYTALALSSYAPYYLFAGIREVLIKGFFAVQDTKTPMWNSSTGVGCNILFSLIFVRRFGIVGIALGTTVSSFVAAVLLIRSAHNKIPSLRMISFFRSFGKQLIAGASMVTVLCFFRHSVTISSGFVSFVTAIVVGLSVYFPVILLLDRREVKCILESLLRKNG